MAIAKINRSCKYGFGVGDLVKPKRRYFSSITVGKIDSMFRVVGQGKDLWCQVGQSVIPAFKLEKFTRAEF